MRANGFFPVAFTAAQKVQTFIDVTPNQATTLAYPLTGYQPAKYQPAHTTHLGNQPAKYQPAHTTHLGNQPAKYQPAHTPLPC
jgi:hypothetical protein